MMRDKFYFRLGLLAAGTLVLAVGMLFYLGLAERLAVRIHFVTIFRESVQGLAVGSAVKYKGVPIGSVTSISIMTKKKLIRVDMKIDPSVFIGADCGRNGDNLEQVYKFCIQEQLEGLRCRLNMAGVTGMRYVEMDYFPDSRVETLTPLSEPNMIYFASVPSTLDNIVDTVAISLDKISKINFEGISNSLTKNLNDLNVVLGDPALKRMIDRLETITGHVELMSKNFSENLSGEELRRIMDGLNRNLDNLSALTESLRIKFDKADVQRMVRQFTETAESIRRLTETLEQSRLDFNWTLRQVNTLLGNAGEFIELLRTDPDALLRGRDIPPVVLDPGQ